MVDNVGLGPRPVGGKDRRESHWRDRDLSDEALTSSEEFANLNNMFTEYRECDGGRKMAGD